MSARVDILGIGFDRLDLTQAAEQIAQRHARAERSFVITANPEFVMLARRDGELAAIAKIADLVVADGTGVLIASRLLGSALPARVPGRLLVPAMLARIAPTGAPVFLLGAGPGIADRAARRLSQMFPAIRIAGTHSGSPSAAEDEAIRVRIRESGARVLLVAYGMPAQERWLSRNLPRLPSVIVAIGVGGVFDQLAGRVRMPPPFVHAVGFEWLWRLLFEPRRWRRQRVLPVFVALVLRERLLGR
ncbi:MAG: WecB/TagA/CpsF family glycosyltransferase [Chloroflexi bacterium]|nr:MAG: WecB/TagA/CpsF family glycosyltransferase [Chloroflexota bacterium]